MGFTILDERFIPPLLHRIDSSFAGQFMRTFYNLDSVTTLHLSFETARNQLFFIHYLYPIKNYALTSKSVYVHEFDISKPQCYILLR